MRISRAFSAAAMERYGRPPREIHDGLRRRTEIARRIGALQGGQRIGGAQPHDAVPLLADAESILGDLGLYGGQRGLHTL